MVIYSDNLSSIQLAKNPVFHARTKHIEVNYHFVRERVLSREVELRYVQTDRLTADIFSKPLGLYKLRQFSGALGLRHLDVPNLRGRDDQEGSKARKEQEEEARHAQSTERRKKAEPSLEKTDDCDSRSDGADDSESESHTERAEERRCDSETLNQPRRKRTRRTQRMRQRRDSEEAEKGRCRPGGSMLHKERIEEHVRGRPKDHTSNMQLEFRGKAKT
jgi:flagellar biosynthesis GTPase FlhF